jgi:hypothetical protein
VRTPCFLRIFWRESAHCTIPYTPYSIALEHALFASGPTNLGGHANFSPFGSAPCRRHSSNAATASSPWNWKAPKPMRKGKPSTRKATCRKTEDRTPRRRSSISQEVAKITATEMPRNAQIDPRLFRQILHDENFGPVPRRCSLDGRNRESRAPQCSAP